MRRPFRMIPVLLLLLTGALAPASNHTLPNKDGSTLFAVIGDTGTGGRAQYDIARQMLAARTVVPFEFVVMLGDNLYGGKDASDFRDKFERPYAALLKAKVPFYAALGNHDDPAERFYKLFNMSGERYYSFKKGPVQFFALDSTYMSPEQLKWIERELQASSSDWKIAFFHHPLYSSGRAHGSEVDLRQLIEPLFIKYGVNVVFSGHEHFYERVRPQKGIYYFTQGGSAKLRRGNIRATAMTAKGFDADNSFMIVEIDDDQLFFEAISRTGSIVDSGAIGRQAKPERLEQTAAR